MPIFQERYKILGTNNLCISRARNLLQYLCTKYVEIEITFKKIIDPPQKKLYS